MNRTSLAFAKLAACALWATAPAGCASPDELDVMEVDLQEVALKQHPPELPAAIAVPSGQRLAFSMDAEGVQIYDCKAAADGSPAWIFRAPEADLLGKHGRLVGAHYAGPTWEALDGSTVVAARLAGATVDASAIPWLLLEATSHGGAGKMDEITYIQRVQTVGGLSPGSGCDAERMGTSAEVPYTATYLFYEANCGTR